MSNEITVVSVLDTLNIGGAQTNAITFAYSVRSAGFRTIFVSTGGILEDDLADKGIIVHRVNMVRFRHSLVSAVQIAGIVKKNRANIIHAHTIRAGISGFIAARMCSVPLVISIHGKLQIVPTGFRVRDSTIDTLSRVLSSIPGSTTRFIVVSSELLDYAVETLGIPRTQIVLIPNAVDVSETTSGEGRLSDDSTTENALKSETYTILWVGRASWDKEVSLRTTMDSVELLNQNGLDVRLRLTGTGPMQLGIRDACAEKNRAMSKRVYTCLDETVDVMEEAAMADVVIGAGRSAIEAISRGSCVMLLSETGYCPVMTEDNIRRVSETNFSGRGLGTTPSAVEMERDIRRLLVDKELRRNSALVGMGYVRENLSVEQLSKRLQDVYSALVSRDARMEKRGDRK